MIRDEEIGEMYANQFAFDWQIQGNLVDPFSTGCG
jgi:hypothetical protein